MHIFFQPGEDTSVEPECLPAYSPALLNPVSTVPSATTSTPSIAVKTIPAPQLATDQSTSNIPTAFGHQGKPKVCITILFSDVHSIT